ncbi:MAG: hypothetical protein GY795_03800 [Desulfobacterales bacterium]|nr:hypothetical protein [Desulfobacterales bacterium]
MSTALKIPRPAKSGEPVDRPGWIPPEITHDWDTNPYAYQTEEELMPAGALHAQVIVDITIILRVFLKKRGLMLLWDSFMLFRDNQGIKQRVPSDLILMPFCFPPPAYDLDIRPPPLCVVEVTSPNTQLKALKTNLRFYSKLGISTYLAVDAITYRATLRKQIELHLWRKNKSPMRKMKPDSNGFLRVPELKVKVKAEGQRIIFADILTGEVLPDMGQLGIENEQLSIKNEQLGIKNEQLDTENKHLQAEIARLKALLAEKT